MAGRILIAGGEPGFRIGLRGRLAATCPEVVQARDAAEAMAMLEQARPEVVVAVAGPDDPGAARLCLGLRAHPASRQAGIVALVGADAAARIAALRAGADDAQSQPVDELMLLARIRHLVGQPRPALSAGDRTEAGMAEEAAAFGPPPRIALIAAETAMAIGWRHALAPRLRARLDTLTPARALQEVAEGQAADLYVIAGDLAQADAGLRLLSELRARPASRDSGFVMALAPERAAMAPIALDLGAGDVLPQSLRDPLIAQEAALRLEAQLARCRQAGAARREDARHRLWAMTDPLTGLHNRRHALPRLEEMAAEAARVPHPLAVMVLDLDRFKTVNDRFGHAAGDAVLAQVARRLAARVAAPALLARLGGEEFLIAARTTSAEAARAEAEALRAAIGDTAIALPAGSGGGGLSVSASIGLAVADPQRLGPGQAMPGGAALMSRADRALLAAKALGRDRVLLAPGPATPQGAAPDHAAMPTYSPATMEMHRARGYIAPASPAQDISHDRPRPAQDQP